MKPEERAACIQELERRTADLEARLLAHSVPPAMIAKLEELEEKLEWMKATQRSV